MSFLVVIARGKARSETESVPQPVYSHCFVWVTSMWLIDLGRGVGGSEHEAG